MYQICTKMYINKPLTKEFFLGEMINNKLGK